MNCPVCKTTTLEDHTLQTNLLSHACPTCGGQWVSGKTYWAWHDQHGDNLAERVSTDDEPSVAESDVAKLCPECGHILGRYRVGRDLAFSLDHCTNCYGIWFDKNEWEILRARNLHDDIHYVFSEAYQSGVFKADQAAARRKSWMDRLGEHDFAEIVRIKRWIEGHPKRRELLAYLLNE